LPKPKLVFGVEGLSGAKYLSKRQTTDWCKIRKPIKINEEAKTIEFAN
jgi:hypothetical protein